MQCEIDRVILKRSLPGTVDFDATQPDGTPRKLLDCSKIHAMGWRHKVEHSEGVTLAYKDFLRMLGDPGCAGKM